jgi:hypothetical protein
MQYIYLSYPPDDYDFAHRLVEDLQDAGYPVFVDAVRDAGTMGWAAETRRAIDTSGAVILILSLSDPRPTGIRHEGVVANRKHKPVIVVARSRGLVPRYLGSATVVDFTGSYTAGLDAVLGVLPNAVHLLTRLSSGAPAANGWHVGQRRWCCCWHACCWE